MDVMDENYTASFNCEKAQEIISSTLDGYVNKKEVPLLFLHLGSCDTCRDEMKEMAEIDTIVRSLKPNLKAPFLSESFHRKVKEGILASDKDTSFEPEKNIEQKQKVLDFLNKVKNNQTFLQALQNSDKEKFIQIAKELGFSFTIADLKKILLDMKNEPESDELSEEDLENVAGGTTSTNSQEISEIGNQLLDLID